MTNWKNFFDALPGLCESEALTDPLEGFVEPNEKILSHALIDRDYGPYLVVRPHTRIRETTSDHRLCLYQGNRYDFSSSAMVGTTSRYPWRVARIFEIHPSRTLRTRLEEHARPHHKSHCSSR
jgi:hypothetical protein